MSFEIGTVYHGLRLTGYCGGGAYGDVYVCEDISGRKLAVKIISKVKLGDDWERELRGVSNYRRITENAPSLLQIYHVEEDAETFFYTMDAADSVSAEVYKADTLAERLKNGPLPKAELYPVLSSIFAGIKIIHNAGFAHRDIKPDNIIFVKGQPKLSDIGLLSSLSATYTQLAGTLDFLPPEERVSDSPGTDRRSRQKNDLYAFGKVIYCSVTGCSPQDFPTVPAELPLTPELKFFLRLAFRLCNMDPLLRLDSLEKTSAELAQIERKLKYGETFRDKCHYAVHTLLTRLSGELLAFARWSRRHWFFLVIALVAAGPLIWYLEYSRKPFDITKVKTQKLRSPELQLSMDLPVQWTVLKRETIRQEIANRRKKQKNISPEEFEKQVKLIESQMENGSCVIFIEYSKPQDFCLIQSSPGSFLKLYQETSEEILKYQFSELFKTECGPQTEVYEIKKLMIADTLCVYTDLSAQPGKTRTLFYLFILKDRIVKMNLTIKQDNYHKRKQELAECLKTLKFDDAGK
ncbi:MAG: protein kinase [Lentisphaeria bacterium]|nr:protein kinase [Lentisphaeria bacterium]